MKASRFTTEQIIGFLQEYAAGVPVGDLLRRHSVSRATFYYWRKKYGTMEVSEAKRLRTLEDENARPSASSRSKRSISSSCRTPWEEGDDHP